MKNEDMANIYLMHEFPPISHSIPGYADFYGAYKKKK